MCGEQEADPPCPSPCTRLCMLDETCGYCLGCGRTREEIAQWGAASPAEQRAIVRKAAARKAGKGT